MKKFLIGIIALVLCLGMNSCKKEGAPEGEKQDAATEKVAEAPSLADVVAKAKAEGANWSVDEWKEAFKSVTLAIKPMMVEMNEVTKKVEADPSKAGDLMKELKAIQAKYPDFEKLMDEFTAIAEGCENGKAVIDDEEWGTKMMEELGVPKLE